MLTSHNRPSRLPLLQIARVQPALIASIAICAGLGVSVSQAQELNAQGWTVLEPSMDTRFVFVSSSSGNDANSGLSPSKAVKTFTRAKELMRDDSADWMLLKRGDVWRESIGTWGFSGRSAQERVVITSYGDSAERPSIIITTGNGITGKSGVDVSNVAITGIKLIGDRPDHTTATGILWLSTGANFLVEDCYIDGFKDNVVCQPVNGAFQDFALRRSVIVDSWSTDGHSQGLYVSGTTGVRIEENMFDHNGWSETIEGANPTQFNQNIYLQKGVLGTEFHGNITSYASGAGIQMRSGGNASHNLVFANPLGIRFGYNTLNWPEEFASGSVESNVVLGGRLSDPAMTGSGTGMWIERVNNTSVKNNLVLDFVEGSVVWAYTLNGYAGDVDFRGNVAYNWVSSSGSGRAVKTSAVIEGLVQFDNNRWHMPETNMIIEIRHFDGMEFSSNDMFGFDSTRDVFMVEGSAINFGEWIDRENVVGDEVDSSPFLDASRNLDAYARSLGLSDSDGFLRAARDQTRTNWDMRLTGRAAADWISDGYIMQE